MTSAFAPAERLVERAPLGWQPALSAWLRNLAHVQWRSAHTVKAYVGDVRQFAEAVADLPQGGPGDVDRLAIRSWLAGHRDAGASSATVQRKVVAVKMFYRFAVRHGWSDTDPAAIVGMPKVDNLLPRVPTPAQAQKMLDACDGSPLGQSTKVLVELLYSVGLRAAEALSVTVDSVDLARREVRVLGKGERWRVCPFAKATAHTFADYLADGRPRLLTRRGRSATTGALVLNRSGRPLAGRSARDRITELAEQAGCPGVSSHSLRHGFGTHLLVGGAGLRDIQELLGHAKLSTTMRYTRVTTELLRSTYEEAHPRA